MKKKIIISLLISVFVIIISFILLFIYNLSPVDKSSDKQVKFVIESGTSKYTIVKNLKKNNLIRSEFFTKLVLKFNNKELYAGTYKISKDMSTNSILSLIESQDSIENEGVIITFIEGKRLENYIKIITDNFNIKEDEIKSKLSDKEYLQELINKYWFLTDDILDSDIYYPLEGYLYPDTYQFKNNSTISDIIEIMLNNLESKLDSYKDDIKASKYSIHELMTLASIVELEGVNSKDRALVSSVFYNRLSIGMSLGSDATTYYAVGKDFSVDLTNADLDSCNGYNTRGSCVSGLPVGPICNPGLSSISASIEPTESDYYYFVADKNKNTYFSKDIDEHNKTISTLKSEGKWYTY